MSRFYSLNNSAKRELREAAAYYESQSKGLGLAFTETVEREVDRLVEFPESAPVLGFEIRAKAIPRFPYTLYYRWMRERGLRVLAVAHQKRRPMYWLDRS